jgi:GH25 family lysozyme M1 (1,4-beta-N-acetylmuramidase)
MIQVSNRPHGIDISKYDLSFDPSLATHQLDFVIQRVSYGLRKDEAFDSLFTGVQKIPLRMGYHYINSGIDYKVQADKFLEYSAVAGFLASACDFEGYANTLTVDFGYECWKWLDYVAQRTGKPVILYTGKYLYEQYLKPAETKYKIDWSKIPLWIAQYPSVPNLDGSPVLPAGRTSWTFWQYSSKGNGSFYGTGRSYALDLDIFNGSLSDLYSFLRYKPTTGEKIMKKGTVIISSLNARSGPGTQYGIVSVLNKGDVVWGELDTASGWLNFTKITRVNGLVENLNAWCSANPSYLTLEDYTPPATSQETVIKLTYDTNNTLTSVSVDGVEWRKP